MPDNDKLGLISLNCDTTHRQAAADESINNSKSQIQTEGRECEQCKGEKQEAETQSKQNANKTPELPIVTNRTVMGNNDNDSQLIADAGDNDSISFISELLINQSFISDEERKI